MQRDNSEDILSESGSLVESLCEDVLIEIFEYLNAEDLQSAALVSTNWNNVIGSSIRIMKKFKISWTSFKVFEPGVSFRKHQNVVINSDVINIGSAWEGFDLSFVASFEVFSLFGDEEVEAEKLLKLLSKMKLIKNLSIDRVKLSFDNDEKCGGINLRNLKTLEVTCDCRVLKKIFCDRLEVLSCAIEGFPDISNFTELLLKSSKLRKLEVNKTMLNELLRMDCFKDCKFRLDSFTLNDKFHTRNFCRATPLISNRKFNNFLLAHSETLTHLSLYNLSDLSESLITTIFNKLNNLSTLSLDRIKAPMSQRFYKQLLPVKPLKSCTVMNIYENFSGFLRKLQAVGKFEYNHTFDAELFGSFIGTVVHLTVGHFPCSLRGLLRWDRLESLKVATIGDAHKFMNFLNRCPSITDLEIEDVDYNGCTGFNEASVEELLKILSLKHLKLGGHGSILETIWNVIIVNHGNLESLTLISRNGTKVGIQFSDGPSHWKVNEGEMGMLIAS